MKRDDKPNSLRVLEWIDEKFMVIRNIWWWFFFAGGKWCHSDLQVTWTGQLPPEHLRWKWNIPILNGKMEEHHPQNWG